MSLSRARTGRPVHGPVRTMNGTGIPCRCRCRHSRRATSTAPSFRFCRAMMESKNPSRELLMIDDPFRAEIARVASSGSVDDILAALLQVRTMYDSSRSTEERAILRPLLDQLRATAVGNVKTLSDEQLAAKLRSARHRVETAIESRMNPSLVGAGGLGGRGIDANYHERVNRAIDESSGLASLQASYRELLAESNRRTSR